MFRLLMIMIDVLSMFLLIIDHIFFSEIASFTKTNRRAKLHVEFAVGRGGTMVAEQPKFPSFQKKGKMRKCIYMYPSC